MNVSANISLGATLQAQIAPALFGAGVTLLAPPVGFTTWRAYGRAAAQAVRHG